MSVSFPPSRRTTTAAEADRVSRFPGIPESGRETVAEVLRAELNKAVAERPYRLDYVNESWGSDTTIGHVCILTNDDGQTQFWLGLNVAHPFVQAIIDWPKEQRDGVEILLLLLHGAKADLDDPEVDRFYQQEMNLIGNRLHVAMPILDSIFWPLGKPEYDGTEEDEEEDLAHPLDESVV